MTFGEKFKAEREKRNLTQQEVADGLGINRRMITRYENGISFPRTKEAYKKIAEYFEVDVNYLLTEDEEFAGGTLSDQDKDAVMKALQDIYWESKARNFEKYTPKKFKKTEADAGE